jgi:hypothetical protein
MNTVTNSRSRVLLEMLLVAQLVKKFSALNGTENFMSLFTGTRRWILWRDLQFDMFYILGPLRPQRIFGILK